MPIYEFHCGNCGSREDRLLSISHRDDSVDPCLACNLPMQRVPSSPALAIWDSSRSFPISGVSDGISFPTKQAYESHMTSEGIGEISTDAPAYNKPCVYRKVYG